MQKKKNKTIKKLSILIIAVIVLIIAIWSAVARFVSVGKAAGEIEIAMYVIEEDYQSMNLNLGKMVPQEEPYIYNFGISNYKEQLRTEVDLEYILKISTTTNIPLAYELYVNENYNAPDANNIILTNTIEVDGDGTYFRKIATNSRDFSYKENQTDIYQLVIYFPSIYKSAEYQNLIESVELIVDSRQVI